MHSRHDAGSFPRWAWAALSVAFGLAAAGALRAVPGPDVSFLLYTAQQLADGARLGTDIVEINPPLIIWIYSLPVHLGVLTGIGAHSALVLLTLAAVAGVLVLLYRILRNDGQCAWIVVATGAGLLVLPQLDFGQREHLAAVLTVPWVGAVAARLHGNPPARGLVLSAALPAAVGFLLKPYFLIAWCALELLQAVRVGPRTLFRLENAVLVLAGAVYVAATLLFVPDFLQLTRTLGPAYAVYQTQGRLEAAGTALGIGIYFWYRRRTGFPRPTLLAFEVAAAGFLLAAVVQLKWWPYHFIPALAYSICPLALAAPDGRRVIRPALIGPIVAGYLLVTAVVDNLDAAIRPWDQRHLPEPYLHEMTARIRELSIAQPRVMVFSTNIQSAFPLLPISSARSSSRLPSLWPLSAAYADQARRGDTIRTRPLEDRNHVERWLTEAVITDVERRPPDLIFVMRYDPAMNDSGGARRFDYLAYFAADARFAALLSEYVQEAPLGRYDVYRRADSTAGEDGRTGFVPVEQRSRRP